MSKIEPTPNPLAPDSAAYRARQRANARVMAIVLGVFVILVFAIAWSKITAGMNP